MAQTESESKHSSCQNICTKSLYSVFSVFMFQYFDKQIYICLVPQSFARESLLSFMVLQYCMMLKEIC